MEPALRRGDRDGVGGGVWRIVLRAQSYARSALTLRAELSKMLCVCSVSSCAVVVTHNHSARQLYERHQLLPVMRYIP